LKQNAVIFSIPILFKSGVKRSVVKNTKRKERRDAKNVLRRIKKSGCAFGATTTFRTRE
jgi:hypothetical protein